METRSTQAKTTALLAEIAEDLGLEMVVDSRWANQGSFRFQPSDRFATILTVEFGFQHDYATFELKPAEALPAFEDADHVQYGGTPGKLRATLPEHYQYLVDRVRQWLQKERLLAG